MKTYFTADLHLSRRESGWTLGREYPNAREMSEHLVDIVNLTVGRKDRLIVVGDFSVDEPAYWRNRLKCKNAWLVLGNHDPKRKCIQAFGKGNVRDTWLTKCCGHPCWMSHYAHAYWPQSHYGSMHVYGHTHAMREGTLNTVFNGRRSMDVGVDHADMIFGQQRPFADHEVYDILMKRPGHDPVQWYKARRGDYVKD